MLRRRSDLPLAGDASGRFLPCIAAAMVYLAALALAGAFSVHAVIERWNAALTGTLTVEIPLSQNARPQNAANAEARLQSERVQRAVTLLRATPGVAKAEALDRAATLKLIEPWLGQGGLIEDLPLPSLIEVSLARDAKIDVKVLAEALSAAVPGSRLDDHGLWLGGVAALARSVEALAGIVLVIVGIVAVAAVVFATRTGLAIHHDVVEVLHLIGARDRYIANQFAHHVFRLSLWGGLVGLGLALLTLAAIGRALDVVHVAQIPGLGLDPLAWASLGLLPLSASLIAIVTARLSVARRLARLP
ncbi:MAG: cell division protein [Proteobacteria bacterium]|nr:cell division protein [Pseudomonadota bacterium]MBI3499400.1 cell division protein [Pseudomonadota bacterium]